MIKIFLFLPLLLSSTVSFFAQTGNYNAPVKWERYKVGDKEVSILFPKLPILIQNSDVCNEVETNQYAAFAKGVVYGLSVTNKTKSEAPNYCTEKRKFTEKNFEDRIKEIKSSLKTAQETKSNLKNFKTTKINGNKFTYWLINDYDNKRWFEIWATEENETNPNIKNFVESFKSEKNPSGIEIGNGSNRTLGDEGVSDKNSVDSVAKDGAKTDKEEITSLRIILKPRANYTAAARQAQLQGTVRLRVTFLASGGIGSVSPVSSLPFGLTEQAIAAASRLVFIPARRNGTDFSVTKLVEYSFTIY